MKALLILLCYVIMSVIANHSAQHERCEILQSVADTDNAGNLVQCTVGQSCFSMSCIPTLPPNSDFRIIIEPCKQPVSILINATISGQKYSHEFSHSETIDVPYNIPGVGTPKLAVVLDNSDNTTLVFSVNIIASTLGNYTIVPETSFPLDNITCVDGHVMTSPSPPTQHTTTTHRTYSCMQTCVAIHKMIDRTNSLCQSTQDCLTINCKSPTSQFNITSSFLIEPCKSPTTILTKFDDHTNNLHYSRNVTNDTNIPLKVPLLKPIVQITLEDPDNYTILFGVNVIVLGITTPILHQQRIPIDKTGCPGYTGPTVNPYCTTQQTTAPISTTLHTTVSGPISTPHHTPGTSVHTHSIAHTTITPSHSNQTAVLSPDSGTLVGVIIGVILLVIVAVGISVFVTLGVVYFVMKRKSKGVYAYSYFQAMEQEDV